MCGPNEATLKHHTAILLHELGRFPTCLSLVISPRGRYSPSIEASTTPSTMCYSRWHVLTERILATCYTLNQVVGLYLAKRDYESMIDSMKYIRANEGRMNDVARKGQLTEAHTITLCLRTSLIETEEYPDGLRLTGDCWVCWAKRAAYCRPRWFSNRANALSKTSSQSPRIERAIVKSDT